MRPVDLDQKWIQRGRDLAAAALKLREKTASWQIEASDNNLPTDLAAGAIGTLTPEQVAAEVSIALGLVNVFDDSRVFAIYPIIGILADGTLTEAQKVAAIQQAIATAEGQAPPRKTLSQVASADSTNLVDFWR